ncbi:MAG: hypothetical protein KC657_13605, partial [Myxococcales bacterium]|nr:hypothetical protein [Myxococcales bacterium]
AFATASASAIASAPAPAPASASASAPAPAITLAPAPAPAPASAPAPAPAPAPNERARTMLGMPASALGVPPPAAEPPAPDPAAARPAHVQKTMLGVAIPGIAPLSSSAPAVGQDAPAPPPLQASPQLHSRVRTMLGVSVSDMHAPQQAAPPAKQGRVRTMLGGVGAVQVPEEQLPTVVPAPAPFAAEPLPAAPEKPTQRGVPAIVVVLVIGLFVVVAGGVGAFFFLRGGEPLVATPRLDDSGKESLQVRCATCPDGTKLSLGASAADVAGHEALLVLPAPLTIGDNKLTVHIDRPGSGRDEDVTLRVPVAYRVRVDLGTLADRPPKITVRVEAAPGAIVKVDGKPLELDANGKAAYAVDVSEETEGESAEVKKIDKQIDFEITPKGGKAEAQKLTARTGILPLKVDAPGTELFTADASASVTGRTKPGSTVTVAGKPAEIDAAGRFSAKVDVEGVTSIDVVASAPPLAPRHAIAKVTRVTDLEAVAKEMDAKAPLGFDAFVNVEASKGKLAAVDGEVAEIRVAGGQTILLVESRRGCASRGNCLVRVVHGAEKRLSRGDSVRAYGAVAGSVTAGGKTVPEIVAPLLIGKAK